MLGEPTVPASTPTYFAFFMKGWVRARRDQNWKLQSNLRVIRRLNSPVLPRSHKIASWPKCILSSCFPFPFSLSSPSMFLYPLPCLTSFLFSSSLHAQCILNTASPHLLALLSQAHTSRPAHISSHPLLMPLSSMSISSKLLYWFHGKTRLARTIMVRTVCLRLKKYLRKILWPMGSINSKSNIH